MRMLTLWTVLLFLMLSGNAMAQFTPAWATQGLGSSRTDESKAMASDAAGNLYICGYFREIVIIGDDTLRSVGNNRRDVMVAKYDPNGNPIWAKAYPGVPAQDDRGRGIAVAPDGSIYITGEMRGDVNFGSILLDHADGTNRNGFIAKLDNNGTAIWANQVESVGGDDRTYGVQVGPDGNVYVTGQCGNNVTFAAGGTPFTTNGGDAFVAQYSASGTFNWAAIGGGGGSDRFFDVIFDENGDIWTCGFANAATSFTYGATTLTPVGDADMILARITPAGAFAFATNFGGAGADEAGALTFGPNGLLYVGGFLSGSATIGGTNLTSAGARDAVVVAFDATGTIVAAASFGGPGDENVNTLRGNEADLFVGGFYGATTAAPGQGITLLGVNYPASTNGDGGAFLTQHDGTFAMKAAWAVNNNGGVVADGDTEDVQAIVVNEEAERVYITGQFFGTIPVGSTTLVSTGSNSDFHVVAFDYMPTELPVDDLTSEWAVNGKGSTRTDEGKSIAADADGNLYVTGYFREIVIIGDDTLRSVGNNRRDVFVAKYNSGGEAQWAKAYPGVPAQDDRGRGIAVAADGSIYITGEIRGDVNFGTILMDHADGTNRNGFLVKLDNNGNVLWANQIESVGGDDRGYGVQVGPDGNVYVAGQCGNNAVFAAGATPVVTTGGVESFVAQYSPTGAINWVAVGGGSGGDRFFDVVFDANGNVWTAGFSGAATTMAYGTFNLTSVGDGDIVVARLSSAGVFTWANNFGGTGLDEGGALTLGPEGLLYVGGFYTDAISIGTKNYISTGLRDALVFALDPTDGAVVNSASFGSTANENVYDLDGTENDLFVSGFYGLNAAAPGAALTLGDVTFPGSLGGDGGAFLTQHDKNFNVVSAIGFQGEGGVLADGDSDDVQSIVVNDVTERVYMTGQFFGTVTIGDETLSVPTGSSNSDFYVASVRYLPAAENLAFVQVVHNSPDPAAALVDVYIDGVKALSDFAFRTATPFVGVDATNPVTIAIAAAGSQSVADALATFPNITLVKDQRYVVVANGVLNPSAFTGVPTAGALDLDIITPALLSTNGGVGTFSFAAMHGSPDAPSVDVFVNESATAAINNLTYPSATSYITLPAASYLLSISASADSSAIIAKYLAPLDALSADGVNAAVVLASGFLNGNNVTNDNGFGLWAALPAGGDLVPLPFVGTAFVQIVHNSPDTTLRNVDVFINDELALDDFPFRTATPFLELNSGVNYKIGIKPSNTTDAPQEFDATFEDGKSYVVTARGLWNPFAYTGVGFSDFLNLDIIEPAIESSGNADLAKVAFQHGSPDAPTVDVIEGFNGNIAVDNFAYNSTTDYVDFDTKEYLFTITPANDNSQIVQQYLYNFLAIPGSGAVVYASGFLNPANAFADAPFGLWAAIPGGGPLFELPVAKKAQVQLVHNSPDPAVAVVDVYINDNLELDNVPFRTATPYLDLIAGYPHRIGLAFANSASSTDVIGEFTDVVFEADTKYNVSVNGVLDPNAFVDVSSSLVGITVTPAQTEAPTGQFSTAVVHGSPDAPTVDVFVQGVALPLVDDISFSENTPFITVPAIEYILDIRPADDNTVLVASYKAPLNALPVSAAVVYASGFLNAANQTGETNKFGLWVAIPSGGPLIPLEDVTVGTDDLLVQAQVKAWPNPTNSAYFVEYNLPEAGNLTFTLTDTRGVEMQRISYANAPAGTQVERFDFSQLPEGVYMLRITSAQAQGTLPVVLTR
jgi:Domain of unknown function (DUF4397)/Secretion system C-terminal sorting domain